MSWWVLLLLGWGLAAGLQLVLYLNQLRTGDATAVDAGWGIGLACAGALYAALGDGDLSHRVLIAVLAGIEFGRVALVVVRRLGESEDSRYAELRARWRARNAEQTRFFVFFQAQALLVPLLSVPFVAAAENGHDGLEPLEWAGVAVWLAGASFEALADRQLRRFKAANGGLTMRSGLWRYSRHPNYFGQWLTWIGFALIALAAPYGWVGLVSPALILVLILFVTGIPPSEEQALKRRGEDYRRYQRETSPFLPLPPRRIAA
jgi:steroid 5-alpha reductase family enzyme